jgi:hypothetical protein
MPHPYSFTSPKKYLANFVGGRTHPIRESAERLKNNPEYYISYDLHDITTYCRILHESLFTLCYRGYGLNSFRCCEAIQYGSIPVMISDEFIIPWGLDFNEFGILIGEKDVDRIDEILKSISPQDILWKQNSLKFVYDNYYTYSANLKLIIDTLEAEYNNREVPTKDTLIDAGVGNTGN